jgi:PTH2 family peptidyl-tRNA hydrolase
VETKQVIVIRNDLRNQNGQKIRTGKICSQVAHASMKVILDMMEKSTIIVGHQLSTHYNLSIDNGSPIEQWLDGIFTKVCLSVDSEEELVSIYEKAKFMNIPCSIITDIGLTEFGGVPTKTSVAIGPALSEEIDSITGHLKLL